MRRIGGHVNTDEPTTAMFYAECIYTVNPETDEHLRTEQAARDELTAWLESLRAEVHVVTVRPANSAGEE